MHITTNPTTRPTAFDAVAIARDVCICGAPVTIYSHAPELGIVTIVPDGRTRAGRMYRWLPLATADYVCGACDTLNPAHDATV